MKKNELQYEVHRAKSGEVFLRTELIIIYVIEGSVRISTMGLAADLEEEGILLVQPGIEYTIEKSNKAIIGMACYPADLVHRLFRGQDLQLFCNSAADHRNSYQDLRDIFRLVTADYTEKQRLTDCYQEGELLMLLNAVAEHYKINPGHAVHDAEVNDERMQRLMQYTMAHLYEDLSLSVIADELYVSTSTLSRLFKKKMGTYFADYVSHLRVQRSLELLEFTDLSLTQIALECGFSNSGYYSRIFSKEMGEPPSAYREKRRQNRDEILKRQQEEEEKIRKELEEKGHGQVSENLLRRIEITKNNVSDITCPQIWNQAINIGPAADLNKANVQFHVMYLQEHLHFSYVRIWNIFTNELMLSDGVRMGPYNYDLLDQVLDFLTEHHLKPFIDFGRRPNMALDSSGNTVFYHENYIPFAGRENWEHLISDLIEHLIRRYGTVEVSGWIFEMSGTDVYSKERHFRYPKEEFLAAYEFIYRLLRNKLPGARFGGLGAEAVTDKKLLEKFTSGVVERDIIPDFMSFILFPDGKEEKSEIRHMEVIEDLFETYDLRSKGVKLYITEWNPMISNRNYLNDSCYRSAYMASRLSRFLGKADMLIVMAGTDWVSSYIDSVGMVNGGIGLLTKEMIRKPAFYAMEFFNQLGDTLLYEDKNIIVTRKSERELAILCFYEDNFRRYNFLSEEQPDLEAYRLAKCSDEIPLQLTILLNQLIDEGEYVLDQRTLNRSHGSILDEWGRFSFENNLGRQEIKYLDSITMPILAQEHVQVKGQQFKTELILKPEEVTLLRIRRVNS